MKTNARTQKREGANIISEFVCFQHASVLETHELGGDGRRVPFPARFFRRSDALQACAILPMTSSARTEDGGAQWVLQEHQQDRYDTAMEI